jgi:hypothetical protein
MSLDEAYLDFTEHFEKRFLLSDYERTFLCRKTDGCSKSLCNCDLNLKLKPNLSKFVGTIISSEHSFLPMKPGMAALTPNFLAW